jgi:hypothetical protein
VPQQLQHAVHVLGLGLSAGNHGGQNASRLGIAALFVEKFGAVPLKDPFAFTPKLPAWIDHEWLSGVIYYQIGSQRFWSNIGGRIASADQKWSK